MNWAARAYFLARGRQQCGACVCARVRASPANIGINAPAGVAVLGSAAGGARPPLLAGLALSVPGKQTVPRAELVAVCRVLELARQPQIEIVTDALYQACSGSTRSDFSPNRLLSSRKPVRSGSLDCQTKTGSIRFGTKSKPVRSGSSYFYQNGSTKTGSNRFVKQANLS